MNPPIQNSTDSSIPATASTPANLDPATNSTLTEDLALALLKSPDVSPNAIAALTKNPNLLKSRKVRLAVAAHPRTPRRIALRLIRELYTFDLMQFALLPAAAADLKRAAGDLLITRIASVTFGERIALARRCSDQVAAALLLDKEPRVWQTALQNPRLTEAAIVKSLQRPNATPALVEALCHHSKWSPRHEIRMALLRHEKTPLACALEFARRLPPAQLRDVLHTSRLPERIKTVLRKELDNR
jgi:hypothetical protein